MAEAKTKNQDLQITLPFSRPYLTNSPGRSIYINGKLSENPYRFSVNFFTTDDPDDDSGSALTINIRFDERAAVFNSKTGGVWNVEERADSFPFVPGEIFLFTVLTTEQFYDIKVNDEHLYSFNHRLSIDSVRRLGINQEQIAEISTVDLLQVYVDSSWTEQDLDGTNVFLTSRASELNVYVGSDATTVAAGSVQNRKAKFTLEKQPEGINIYTLKNERYRLQFLTITTEKQLAANRKSDNSNFRVTETNESYYRFESVSFPRSFIGVNTRGEIVPPDRVVLGPESQFYDGSSNTRSKSSSDNYCKCQLI